MAFTVRSLGGKLIVVATFILLLCMLLFALLSWLLLTFYSEHEARNAAQSHLFQAQQAYQAYTTTLRDELRRSSADTALINAMATSQSSASQTQQDEASELACAAIYPQSPLHACTCFYKSPVAGPIDDIAYDCSGCCRHRYPSR